MMQNVTMIIEEKDDKRNKHLKSVADYQKRNAEKCCKKYKEYYNRLKYLNPTKYKEMLDKKKKYRTEKSKNELE